MKINFQFTPARSLPPLAALWLAACCLSASVAAQSPPPGGAPAAASQDVAKPAAPLELSSLSWLEGCWKGEVAQHEFLEHWLPLRGGLMIGAAHVVFQGNTQEFEYLRLETRADGVYYVAIPFGKKETPFKLTAIASDQADTIFTFTNPVDEFPQRILYRRGKDGWLYAHVEGKTGGKEQTIIYPMRRIDCRTGALIKE